MREWLPTETINMTVQSSEVNLSGFDATPCLNVICNLTSIARGQVALKVRPVCADETTRKDVDEDSDAQEPWNQLGGRIEIRVDRAIMDAEINVPADAFDRLCQNINLARTRLGTVTLHLSEKLSVSVEGDLKIEGDLALEITDLPWTLPLG